LTTIPDYWAEPRLAELGEFIGGLAFRPQDTSESAGPDSIACFRTSNIQEALEQRDVLFIPRRLLRSEDQVLWEGDVLISTANSDNLVGKSVIIGNLSYEATLGGFITAFRVTQPYALPRFLHSWLSSPPIRARLRSLARKTTNIANLATQDLRSLKVPLPPLSEQKRIVEILQEAKEIRRLHAEAEAKRAELVPAMFFDRFVRDRKDQYEPLSNLADVVSGVALGRKINGTAMEVPYLRVANVQAGYMDLNEVKTTPATEEEIRQFRLIAGDILLTEGGDFDKLGRGCLWEGQVDPCIHQNHVFRVRPYRDALNSHFFAHYLQSARAKQYFLKCAKKTTNLASINLTQLKALPVPKVSMDEQAAFEEAVRAAQMPETPAIATQSEQLFRSVAANAFSGQLTAAWREERSDVLASEATHRDLVLKRKIIQLSATCEVSVTFRASLTVESDPGVTGLNAEQRNLLIQTRSRSRQPDAARYFTAESLSHTLDGPLRRNPQAIEGHLAVLTARGLVIPLSLEEQKEASGAFEFGNAYRLPRPGQGAAQDAAGDAEPEQPGDGARTRELERLAARLEQDRAGAWGCARCSCPASRR
jgi:type I restriction enzyme S subunit